MPASFAGTRLCVLPTDYREWVDQWHSWTDFRFSDLWHFDCTGIDHLPLPTMPDESMPEVGTLYWPTGLSRCAFGHFLIDSVGLADIRTELGAGSAGPGTFVLTGDGTVSVELYMLCARPLAQIENQTQLYLMTLVDQRYYLREMRGDVEYTPVDWAALFTTLTSQLDVTIDTDSVHADYLIPNDRWVLHQKPLCVLVDAVANAVGHRVVANLDGTFSTVSYTTARTNCDAQTSLLTKTAGGLHVTGDLARSAPASVITEFSSAPGGFSSDTPYTVTTTLSSLSITEYDGGTGVTGQSHHHVGEAYYDGSNASDLSTYAGRVARDYYNWRLVDVDVTYPAITEWTPTGCEDRIEWKYHIDRILTRVVRPPFQILPLGAPTTRSVERGTPVGNQPGVAQMGCAWLAGLEDTECLLMTIVAVSGLCSDLDTDQEILLTWDAGDGRWESDVDEFVGTGSGGNGTVIFGKTNGVPYSTIDGVYGTFLGCDGIGSVLFGFGTDVLCGDTGSAVTCNNTFVVRFECVDCAGADGESTNTLIDGLPTTIDPNTTFQFDIPNSALGPNTTFQIAGTSACSSNTLFPNLTIQLVSPNNTFYDLVTQPADIDSPNFLFSLNQTNGVEDIDTLDTDQNTLIGVYTPDEDPATYTGPVVGTWSVLIQNAGDCAVTITEMSMCFGTASTGLTLSASADPASGSSPLSVDLDLTVGGTPTMYSVSWDDGSALEWSTSSTGFTHEFDTEGTYEVVVRAWTACGTYVEDTVTVTVEDPIQTACCVNTIAQTLYAHFTGDTGCLNLSANPFPVVWDAVNEWWQGTGTINCDAGIGTDCTQIKIRLVCSGGNFGGSFLQFYAAGETACGEPSSIDYIGTTCSPFEVQFEILQPDTSQCCAGDNDIFVSITETP